MTKDDITSGGGALHSRFKKAAVAVPSCVVSARVTLSERGLLQRQAAGMSMSDFIRSRLLNESSAKPRRTRGKFPVKDHEALAKVLGALGRSGLADDFHNLEIALDDGIMLVSPETDRAIRQACTNITAMRDDLLKAMGLKVAPP